jgi:hypothetical protein
MYAIYLLTGFPDMYPMMKYCYEHDEWKHTDECLQAALASTDGKSAEGVGEAS